ncbi:MAG TPA: PLD nuclease N-terminal domain-containing protein [Gammaproteobacteria bacterium]|nr:PLD nuclease N-terminal domain-containing protein [Gammaproteobacteria bacterium]
MGVNVYGITGLILLILDVWALINIINSSRDNGAKVLWVLLVLIFPLVGFIAWLVAGPRSS